MLYVDLYCTQFARVAIWLLSLTTLLECTYIFPSKDILYSDELMKYNKNYDKEYIIKIYDTFISYLRNYGKIIHINSKDELKEIMNNEKNYLFHSVDPVNYSDYNSRYIFIHHGFDLFTLNYNQIYNNNYINRKVSINDYDFKFNDKDIKIYNILNNERTKNIANTLDFDKFNYLEKPIILIIGSSVNKLVSFEKFLSNNLNDLIKLSNTYDIIIRPHPKCAGKDIYRQLKKLNNNFIIDLNITFITSIDKSDIIISYGLTSLIDNYALWYNKKILLIYEQHCWEKLNHKGFKNTDKILNNKCCVIQDEKSIDILSGINDVLKINEKQILQYRKKFLNNYFYIKEKNGHKIFFKNILEKRKIIMKKKYFLSVQSVFKNESHILEEWLNHYIKEGVEHFYLFNNNSTDDFMSIINKYNKYIDLFDAKENYKQLEHLNSKFDKIKEETEWIINIDLDEFLFTKEDYKTLPDIINDLDSNIINLGGIRIQWMLFNSNNHINQPKSVIKSFTNRLDFNKTFKEEKIKTGHPNKPNGKWIAKTNLLIDFTIHTFRTKGKINYSGIKNHTYKGNNKIIKSNDSFENHLFQINHYLLQSKEWFFKVKCTRGDVDNEKNKNIRNIEYFNKYNKTFTGYTDTLLKNKKYK